jgi:hypothetical protein
MQKISVIKEAFNFTVNFYSSQKNECFKLLQQIQEQQEEIESLNNSNCSILQTDSDLPLHPSSSL